MLVTDRLVLRRFADDDVDALFEVISAEGVFEFFPGDPEPTPELAARMTESIVQHWEEHGYGLFSVLSHETGAFLGRCGLQYLPETSEVEVDFVLDPGVWGRGYATEAARASLEYGFETIGVEEIVGIVHPENAASKRVLEKIGMTLNRRTVYFGMTVDHYSAMRVQ